MGERRVVITGLGVVAPNGIGLPAFETALRTGRSGIRYQEKMAELQFGCQVGGVPIVSEELKHQYFSELTVKRLSADGVVYGCIAGADAWTDAGLPLLALDAETPDWDSGCIMGTGLAGTDPIRDSIYHIDAGNAKRLGSSFIQQSMPSGVSAYLAGTIGLGNQNTTNASACSTGTEAILMGYERIRAGKALRMVCGGTDSASPYLWAGFDAMRVLTRKSNDRPEEASRPLSASAMGFVPGGGAAAVLLEDLETALARGARIYAELLGGYVNSGGQRNGGTMTAPNREGIRRCIQGALTHTGVAAADIDAISGHLTATMLDTVEVGLWAEGLGRFGSDFPYINALKSMTGHCLSAAGAIEAVAAALQVHQGFLHPSINCDDLHPEIEAVISADRIPKQALSTDIRIMASSSFGFGDANSIIIFKQFDQHGQETGN
ncbi:MAG: beta-ketoacyl-[acyl-carrier-protein] synthase family protein [Bacteroidia bacterium]|nr:beta-ketoacyl-[acyl-carrier-protein] synthase family protein [Bacteroidia bacterium]